MTDLQKRNLFLIWLAVLLFGGWLLAQDADEVTLDYTNDAPMLMEWADAPESERHAVSGQIIWCAPDILDEQDDGCVLTYEAKYDCFRCVVGGPFPKLEDWKRGGWVEAK